MKKQRRRTSNRRRTRELFWVLGAATFGLAAALSCWQKRDPAQIAAPEAVSSGASQAPGEGTPPEASVQKRARTFANPEAATGVAPSKRPLGSPADATPSASAIAPSGALEHRVCLWGCPRLLGARSARNRWLVRPAFVLSNNPLTKFADLAIYRVSPGTIGKSVRKSLQSDPDLPPEETLEPEDYKHAHRILHTDRGHQVPLASLSSIEDTEPLNYLSNVTPQRSTLNQNAWNSLEMAVRDLVLTPPTGAVFVITGPLFERQMPTLPKADEPHQMPSGYFKIVAREGESSPEVAAFIMDQQASEEASHCDFSVPVRQVEKRAQLDVFSSLPDQVEETVETGHGLLLTHLGCSVP